MSGGADMDGADDWGTGRAVPSRRLSRTARMGGLAGGLVASTIANGIGQVASGRRPNFGDMILTPANAQRVASELSNMRGAAMKVGQLISMDAGDLLPPEIAAIFDRLRSGADPMPPRQLRDVLDAAWGTGWRARFSRFDVRPMAAASIGQVHRAVTRDGRDLAVKVQYPGVRDSIDSDVANIRALIRLSGSLPRGIDLDRLMEDAKRQLREEADYAREGENIDLFRGHLSDLPGFVVPRRHPDLCTDTVLAMDYLPGTPVEALTAASQEVRDDVVARLIDLVLRELFAFSAMQTDPNFANYLVDPDTARIVLLDFGAVRRFDDDLVAAYRRLMEAGLSRDRDGARIAARQVGLIDAAMPEAKSDAILEMFDVAMAPIRQEGPFDFGATDLAARLRDMGLRMGRPREFGHVPPSDTLLIQRKVAGTYLLAARLRARVDLGRIVARYR